MGAYGAAILAKEEIEAAGRATAFCGFESAEGDFSVKSMECGDCSNMCEVVQIYMHGAPKACWGDRCGKWSAGTSKVG